MSLKTGEKQTLGSFVNKVLAGTAVAIVVALIPNAILGELFKYLITNHDATWLVPLARAATVFQFTLSLMAGVMVGIQFKLTPMQSLSVGGAAFIGSGAWKVIEVDGVSIFQLSGTGDMINTMITAGLAVYAIQLVGHKFGSLNIILLPILIGLGVGFIGLLLYPYVSGITTAFGNLINTFTNLAPLPMSILIGMSFAFLIISPMSTVALGIAIGLNGVSAGAAAMGVAATTAVLVLSTMRVNKPGVPIAIALGSMKMMMPNFFKKPIMIVAMLANAIVCAIPVAIFSISGVPTSAGFGLVGLVGPIASLPGLGLPLMIICWIVIPFVSAFIINYVLVNVVKLYSYDIFKFEGVQ